MDMQPTLAPKSNQLNADDLIAGPITITITKVSPTGNEQQPVAVSFEDDNGKPYLPCKGMRRIMVAAWGRDAKEYIGRQMTLWRDPEVIYGGIKVGGIRISHMSHIDNDMAIALTTARGKRTPYLVRKLQALVMRLTTEDSTLLPVAPSPPAEGNNPVPRRRTN